MKYKFPYQVGAMKIQSWAEMGIAGQSWADSSIIINHLMYITVVILKDRNNDLYCVSEEY